MAVKSKTIYVCEQCGYESGKWYGKCPQCGSWNTLQEQIRQTAPSSKKGLGGGPTASGDVPAAVYGASLSSPKSLPLSPPTTRSAITPA